MMMIAQPGKVTSVLVLMAVCLILASLSGSLAKHLLHDDCTHGLVPLFDLDGERNIPGLFSTLVILLCAFFLSMIGACHANGRKDSSRWLGLAGLFVYLAADELVSLHESLTEPIRAALHTSGIFYFAWLIPYSFAALFVGIIYLRFLFELPVLTRRLAIASGLIYVSGAIGLELIGGWYVESVNGKHNLPFELLATCEESLEMFGMILFAYALMTHIRIAHGGICVLRLMCRPIFRLVVENTASSGVTPECGNETTPHSASGHDTVTYVTPHTPFYCGYPLPPIPNNELLG